MESVTMEKDVVPNFGGDSLVKTRGLRGPLNYLSFSLLAFIKNETQWASPVPFCN